MKILFVEPHENCLFSFRQELLDELILEGHQIVLVIEATKKIIEHYSDKVYKIVDVKSNLKNKSVIKNFLLKKRYGKIIKLEKPDIIISFQIKPNIYCGLYAKEIPMIANVTGLGNLFKKDDIFSKIGISLYKRSMKNVDYIFFQNNDGLRFFLENKMLFNKYELIPGSGVNLEKFLPDDHVATNNVCNFLFASRAIVEKGFFLMLDAIPLVIEKNKNVHFNFLVAEEDVLADKKAKVVFEKYTDYVSLYPRTDDMRKVYAENDFLVLPSYYREGVSNVLLESLSCCRPIITTGDNPGCMEVVQDGVNGFAIKSNDLETLVDAIYKASLLSKDQVIEMGINGRKYVSEHFNRKTVVEIYLKTIQLLKKDNILQNGK